MERPSVEERAFAVLTASYHKDPILDELLGELSAPEAREVAKLSASLVRGLIIGLEVSGRLERGKGVTLLVERFLQLEA